MVGRQGGEQMLRDDDAIVLCECDGGRSSDGGLHTERVEGTKKGEEVRHRRRFEIGIRILISKAKKTSRSWI